MDFILKEFKYNQNKRNKRNKSLNYHSKERNMSTCPLVRLSAAADRPLRPARRGGPLRYKKIRRGGSAGSCPN
jgi:hypothetical protein